MAARVLRVAGNVAIKTAFLVLYNLTGWAVLYPAAPHREADKILLVAVVLGTIFTGVFMTTLAVCHKYALRTHAGSLVIQPVAGWVVLAAVLWLAPQYLSIPDNHWLKFLVTGAVLATFTLPIKSRKDRQLVVVSGPQPPE